MEGLLKLKTVVVKNDLAKCDNAQIEVWQEILSNTNFKVKRIYLPSNELFTYSISLNTPNEDAIPTWR